MAGSHLNIGVIHAKMGDFEKAPFHYRRAQEVFIAVHGHDHPDVASSKQNIGLLFKQTNRKEEAKHLFLEAAAIRRTCADVTTRRQRSQKDWQRNVSRTNK